MQEYFLYMGMVATIWITLGVYIAAKFYPNYNHSEQFCSELGARGAATEKLSPVINNYPLGLLFVLFGAGVVDSADGTFLLSLVGGLIVVHGVGTWVAGYFPMDADPYTVTPSFECIVHSWAGFFMLMALLIAPLLVVFHPTTLIISEWFRVFSGIVFIGSIYSLYLFKKSFKQRKKLGMHQRVSYGIQLGWLNVFSYILVN